MAIRNTMYKVEFKSGNVIYVNQQDAFKYLEDSKVKQIILIE